jgi:hypothetical protein
MPLTDCKFVWKNGKIVPWNEATVHVSCHGLHYGTGVFEGIRCYDTPSGRARRYFASAPTSTGGLLLPAYTEWPGLTPGTTSPTQC